MKIFLSIFFVIFFLQSWATADDITEFEIEGMSIGDSVLKYYSKKELKSMVDDKEIIFRDIYKNNVIPIEGFIQMLESIKSQKILVGLASNAIRENVKMILNELKIYNEFESIICGDEVENGKPNPEMFNKTAKIFKLDKKDCLIFEDSIEGLQGAVNSGIDAIGVKSSSSDKILKSAGAKGTIKNYLNINFKLKKIGLSFQ